VTCSLTIAWCVLFAATAVGIVLGILALLGLVIAALAYAVTDLYMRHSVVRRVVRVMNRAETEQASGASGAEPKLNRPLIERE
jgi:hypothetical protein